MARSVSETLIADLDSLPYRDRMRLQARRAQALAPVSWELDTALTELLSGDRYRRRIAVFMATVTGHAATLETARTDDDPGVRCAAEKQWLRAASAKDIAAMLADASWQSRRRTYRWLRRDARTDLADKLIDAVWQRYGDTEAAALLAVCSTTTVARLLPDLGYLTGTWKALGERHPRVVVDVANKQLAELPVPEQVRWWERHGAGVLAAASAEPLRVLELLEEHGPADHLPAMGQHYAALAAADATRLITLLAAPGRARWFKHTRLPGSLRRTLVSVDNARLAPVAVRLRDDEAALADFLGWFAPARRAELYAAAYAGVDRSQALPASQLLDTLPRETRYAEVDRILSLPHVRGDIGTTLRYTAFLPWDQVKSALTKASARTTADDRATGYVLLIECAARSASSDALTEAVEQLRRLTNEQDPVRAPALAALSEVPTRLFAAAAAPALRQITDDAAAARDASWTTRRALADLAVAVLRDHPDNAELTGWALHAFDALTLDHGPYFGGLDTNLRRGQEVEVFAAVRDWLVAGTKRGNYVPLFTITRALGRRAYALPELQDMLRRAIDKGNVTDTVRRAISLWLADPAHRSERVAHVLEIDSSAVALHDVWSVLSWQRTDLLDDAIPRKRRKLPRGMFIGRDEHWVPTEHDTRRWLPRQQASYGALLSEVIADRETALFNRRSAFATAALLPGIGWDIVHRHIDNADTAIAEAALAALATTDRPADALPILLRHSGGDRARVAMYAAGRAARAIEPTKLGVILADVLARDAKVTSRKEVIRLAARLSVPNTEEMLTTTWAHEQHRDVRAAVVAAAQTRLHDPVSWPILEASAVNPTEALAAVGLRPAQCAPRFRHRYGALVAQICADTTDPVLARAACAALYFWVPWTSDIDSMIIAKLTNLEDRSLWRYVVPVLDAVLDAGHSSTLLPEVVSELAALDHEGPERDRPGRRRLRVIVEHLAEWAADLPPDRDREPMLEASRWLARRPDFNADGATLVIAALVIQDGSAVAAALRNLSYLVADQPATAARLAETLALRADDPRDVPVAALEAATELADDGRLSTGLFAVALANFGAPLGWPTPWQSLVHHLRVHPQSDVRAAALDLVLYEE